MKSKQQILAEMDATIASWEKEQNQSEYDDLSDLDQDEIAEQVANLSSTIERFAPPGSVYAIQCSQILGKCGPSTYFSAHAPLAGILRSLRNAYSNDYLETVTELVHAAMFDDFLEMAGYLLEEGYKDPAAVLVGGVLEEHLRKLCGRFGIAVTNSDGSVRKASQMNDDLAKVAFDKLRQKGVTYWLDIRNKAAHGKYGEFDENAVRQMLMGVTDFIAAYPA